MHCLKKARLAAQATALLLFLFFTSACANHVDLAGKNSQTQNTCALAENQEIACRFTGSSKHSTHEEYTQQLLPIYQRKDIIRQQLEDAIDKF